MKLVVVVLLFTMPFASIFAAAAVVAMHFLIGMSLWWTTVPIALLALWCYADESGCDYR